MTVELKTTAEAASRRRLPPQQATEPAAGANEPAASARIPSPCRTNDGPYDAYLLTIRRKIEGLWTYPPQALSEQEEGSAVIRFTIDADGALTGYHVNPTSGSPSSTRGRWPSSGPPPPSHRSCGLQSLSPPYHRHLPLPPAMR